VARTVPRHLMPNFMRADLPEKTEPFRALGAELEPGTVVAAQTAELRRVAPAYGANTLAPGYAAAFVDDAEARLRMEQHLFIAMEQRGERMQRARKAGVEVVLCADLICAQRFIGTIKVLGPELYLVRLED